MNESKPFRTRREQPPAPEVWSADAVTDATVWRESDTATARSASASTSPLERALFIVQAQEKFLQKAREALERMLELAILAQQSVPAYRELYLEEFETLVSFLEKLSDTEIEGIKLFQTPNLIVHLPDESDTLVLPGIDLHHPSFRAALSAKIDDPVSSGAALGALQNAGRWLAIGRSLTATNLERLNFLHQRMDQVKQVVLPRQ